MSKLVYRKPEIDDYKRIRNALEFYKHTSCDYTAANIYLWSTVFNTEIAFIDDDLYIKYVFDNEVYFAFPFVKKHLKEAIQNIEEYAFENDIEFKFGIIEPDMFELMEKIYPGRFDIEYRRDSADYIYNVSDLADLAGRKYHGKKNHINKFKKTYDNWSYEKISDSNYMDCINMVNEWAIWNNTDEDEEKSAEVQVMKNALEYRHELNLTGGLIRIGERVVAVTLGERNNDEMFVVHFEKAFANIQGAYTMINQQFVQNELREYKYVNREEDVGLEGLRKAKMSYIPAFMGKKGVVTLKQK